MWTAFLVYYEVNFAKSRTLNAEKLHFLYEFLINYLHISFFFTTFALDL